MQRTAQLCALESLFTAIKMCPWLQWAERLLAEGKTEQWGEKWKEDFKDGKGNKTVS